MFGDERGLAGPAVAVDAAERGLEIGERLIQMSGPGGRIGRQGERGWRRQRRLGVAQAVNHSARLEAQLLGMAGGPAAEAEQAGARAGSVDALAGGADADKALVELGGGAVAALAGCEVVPLLLDVRAVRRLERPPGVVEQEPEGLLQPLEAEGLPIRRHPREQRLHPLRRLRGMLPRRRRHHPRIPLPPRDLGRRHRSPPPLVGRGGPEAAGSGRPSMAWPLRGATGWGAGVLV